MFIIQPLEYFFAFFDEKIFWYVTFLMYFCSRDLILNEQKYKKFRLWQKKLR